MKILYDHQMFSLQKFGGVTRYFAELVRHLPAGTDHRLSALYTANKYLHEYGYDKIRFLDTDHMQPIYKINASYSLNDIIASDFDIFHPTYYDNYFIGHLRFDKPLVITVHDMIAFKFADTFCKANNERPLILNLVRMATRIIAISHNTKKDIIEQLGTSPDRIDVIHHGVTHPDGPPGENIHGEYILYVGGRWTYKNFKRFARAAALVMNEYSGLSLVCTGSPFTPTEIDFLTRTGIIDRTVCVDASSAELNTLYAHAQVFVNPSIYEGFGMTILEAFANRCPVVCSHASCFPEIAGRAARFFDPWNVDEIASAITAVITDASYAVKLMDAGSDQLKKFSWDQCASETVATYNRALS